MKRWTKLTALVLAVVMLLSLSGCGGFEMKMARAATKMSKLKSLHMDMDMQLELSMPTILGQSLRMNVSVNGGADSSFSPLLTRADLTVSALKSEKELLYYLEQTGDEYVMYLSTDGGGIWLKKLVNREDLPAQLNLDLKDLSVFRDCAKSFAEIGTEELPGGKATRYDGVIEGEFVGRALALTGALDALRESLGLELDEENLDSLGSIPTSVWIDNRSGMIVRYSMEPTQALQTVIRSVMGDLLSSYGLGDLNPELNLDRAVVTVDLSSFNGVDPIVIPAAAKAA